jgi:hypothetical protein
VDPRRLHPILRRIGLVYSGASSPIGSLSERLPCLPAQAVKEGIGYDSCVGRPGTADQKALVAHECARLDLLDDLVSAVARKSQLNPAPHEHVQRIRRVAVVVQLASGFCLDRFELTAQELEVLC